MDKEYIGSVEFQVIFTDSFISTDQRVEYPFISTSRRVDFVSTDRRVVLHMHREESNIYWGG